MRDVQGRMRFARGKRWDLVEELCWMDMELWDHRKNLGSKLKDWQSAQVR